MVKKKSLMLKLRFFLVYTGIFARIYDSAASSASPLDYFIALKTLMFIFSAVEYSVGYSLSIRVP